MLRHLPHIWEKAIRMLRFKMSQPQNFLGLPRDAIGFVPVLVMPALLGAGLLLAMPGSALGRGGIIIATIAVAWYLLGGAISADHMLRGLSSRRVLNRLRGDVQDHPDPTWITDRDGFILAQNLAAISVFGEMQGGDIRRLVSHCRADADTEIRSLQLRADRHGQSEIDFDDDRRLTLRRQPGTQLQLWSCAPIAPDADRVEPDDHPHEAASDFDDLPVALLRLGADGMVRQGNLAARRLLGGRVEGQHFGSLVDGPGRAVGDWIADVALGRCDGRAEMLRRRGSDSDKHYQVALARDQRHPDGLIAVLSDASALKTLEAQFVQSQKMQAIGQLAGGVAHDFNNLLTAISGHCDLLMLRRDKADPDYADLDQISQNANRAAALVGQLLAFSRKQTLKPTILNVRDTLADLTHLLNRLVGERVSLTISHEADLLPIRADRRQLEQVIMNLVVNARDAMRGGGDIDVRSRSLHLEAPLQRDRVTLPAGDYVCIDVKDEGSGIAPEHLGKIFEPFFTTKRTGEGTGLGLSTAYGIVKQTGGFIFCDSTVGQGTVFSLYFPAHDGPEVEAHQQPSASVSADPESTRNATILLVEDEAPVRAFAVRALKLKGYEVLEADSAEAALELLSDQRVMVDVFVTDVVMPGMDGPSWVRTALRDRPDTRVIFVSGYTEDIFAEGHAPIANSVFLAKPFSLSELTETVDRHLRDEISGPTLH